MSGDQITISISADALNELRTAALERMWSERSTAERLGTKKLKVMAEHAGGLSQRYMHAVQALDQALSQVEQAPPAPEVIRGPTR